MLETSRAESVGMPKIASHNLNIGKDDCTTPAPHTEDMWEKADIEKVNWEGTNTMVRTVSGLEFVDCLEYQTRWG